MEEPKNTWWNNNDTETDAKDNGEPNVSEISVAPITGKLSKRAQRKAEAQLRPKKNKLAIVVSIALVATMGAGLVTANFTKPNPYEPHPSQHGSIEYPATIPGIIDECGSIFNFSPDPKYYGQFPKGFFDDAKTGEVIKRQTFYQPMIVPAYGYMSNVPIKNPPSYISPETTKMPTKEQVLRLMWDGWTIIWYVPPGSDAQKDKKYDATLTLSTLSSIKDYAESHEKTLALPWMGEKPIPSNRNLAFSSWATSQSCNIWDSNIVDDFKEKATELAQPRPVEPPYARVAPNGELYPIDVPQ